LNRQFVAHFGEMGSRRGINRTVGQMYALIFLPPPAQHGRDRRDAGVLAHQR